MNIFGPWELDKPLNSFEVEFNLDLDALFALNRGLPPDILPDLIRVWHVRMMC